MASDGTDDRPLFADTAGGLPYRQATGVRDPDDQMLAVPCQIGSQNRLFLVSLDGKILSKPLVTGVFGEPTFNAAGTKIAFWRAQRAGGAQFLAEVNVSGGPITQLTHGQNDNDPVFSPVDDTIAYRSGPGHLGAAARRRSPSSSRPARSSSRTRLVTGRHGDRLPGRPEPAHRRRASSTPATGAQVDRITGVGAETIAWGSR